MAVLARDSVTLATINDLKRASVYYKLQSSNLAPPTTPATYPPASGSGWVTIEPGYITGSTDTLYTIHVMEFSNGDYDYLPVQKSSSYEAAKQAYNAAVAASKAATSADGKTTIETRPPTAQDAAGKPEGASWEVTNGTFITKRYVLSNGTWVQTKVGSDYIGDNAIGTAHIIDASIDSAKVKDLDVGKLTAVTARMDQAAVRQIIGDAAWFGALTAGKLLIGNSENLIPNGDLAQGGVAPWKMPLQVDTTDAPTGLRASLVTPPGQPTTARVNGDDSWITVKPGSKLRFEVWLKADKPGSKFYLELRDEANNHAGSMIADTADAGTVQASTNDYLVANATLNTTWTKYTGAYQLNDGISQVRLGSAYFNHPGGSERQATVWLAGARLTPMVGAVQIEDGAITATKIDLDSLEAAKFIAVGGVNQISRNELTQDLNQSLDDIASDLGTLASNKADVSVTDGLTEKVDSVEGSLTNQILEVASGLESANTNFTEYTTRLDQRIVMDDTGVTISQAGSDFAVRITNDRMAFLQGSSEVAYLSNSKLFITDTEILNSLVLGKFSFEPRANGNLSFKYGA